MRRKLRFIALASIALAGCGLGEGEERAGGGAELRVTRDFGRTQLGAERLESVSEGQTVMRFLRSRFDVDTRFGGRFVHSVDGLPGSRGGEQLHWFYFVNGIEASVGAAEYELSPGDRVQWDRRNWEAAMRIPAIVGAFPEPFRHGIEGKKLPVRVECEDAAADPCEEVKRRLRGVGVSASGSAIGVPGAIEALRVVVGTWEEAKVARAAAELEEDPAESGVFARVAGDGRSLELLDEAGRTARRVGPGDGTGIVAAARPTDDELVWLVIGLDEEGVAAAARALDERRLRNAFAVAVTGDRVENLPLEAP
ncbi:MAG TPA: DUF4430 domain-containing protein [Thermoleophilaceae bacterium]|nr:DUF4430 domain-containing protein [Thermoleophilaceae bacterium]